MSVNFVEFFLEALTVTPLEQALQSIRPIPCPPPAPLRLNYSLSFLGPQPAAAAAAAVDDSNHIYDIDNLDALIQQLKAKSDVNSFSTDMQEKHTLRYLITPDWQLVFAESGFPIGSVPSHRDMNPRCLAAGYLQFNPDFSHIERIDNVSNFFPQQHISLLFMILKLIEHRLPISPNLAIHNQQAQLVGHLTSEGLEELLEADFVQVLYDAVIDSLAGLHDLDNVPDQNSPRTPR